MPHTLTKLSVFYRKRRGIAALEILAGSPLSCPNAVGSAAPYPERTIQIITQAATGSGQDVVGGVVAEQLSRLWRRQGVIVNRPGADGILAAQAAVRRDARWLYALSPQRLDVLFSAGHTRPTPIRPTARPRSDRHGRRAADGHRSIPHAWRQQSGRSPRLRESWEGNLFYAGGLRGGLPDLVGAMLNTRLGTNLTYVHYVGTAKALPDVIAGQIPVVVDGIAALSSAMGATRSCRLPWPRQTACRNIRPSATVPETHSRIVKPSAGFI